ncbi:MAG: hypothetical protein LUQ59_06335, partial [Methanothrix sp.]|nr:hypothetical protein [Methanothrix sp.]
ILRATMLQIYFLPALIPAFLRALPPPPAGPPRTGARPLDEGEAHIIVYQISRRITSLQLPS